MIKRVIFFGALLLLIACGLYYILPPHAKKRNGNGPYTHGDPHKKKILIFTSGGGGGHISVSNALIDYLKDDYHIGSVFMFADVLSKVDPVQTMFGKRFTGEDWYNNLIKRKWNFVLNVFYTFGTRYYGANKSRIVYILKKYLQNNKPDLIISVVPLVNDSVLEAAKQLDIPFLLIPTDLDATMFIQRIKKPTYDKFHLALSYDDPEICRTVCPAQLNDEQVSIVGFPVKPGFFEPRNQNTTRKELDIPPNKPVILILMGAQGSEEIYEFSKQLSRLKIPAHLLIAIGRSEHLRVPLQKIKFPSNITYSIIGFTDQIPNLMAVSDLFITKSGSVSVNEALYSNLPQLLDGTSLVLEWEKFNHKFIKSHNFGDVITRHSKIVPMVTDLLTNQEKLDGMKKSLKEFDKKNTPDEIRLLIRKILR